MTTLSATGKYFDKEAIKAALLNNAEEVCRHLFSNGKLKGDHCLVGNIYNDAGESLKINLKTGEFNDFADHDIKGGNLLSLWALVTELSWHDALCDAAEWVGAASTSMPQAIQRPTRINREPDLRPMIPILRRGTNTELSILANQRGFPIRIGLEVAYERGLFALCIYMGHLCWIVLDPSGRVAQARRLDGKPFFDDVDKMTLKYAKSCWPIGYSVIGNAQIVIITEGGADLITAITAAWLEHDGQIDHIAFCSILGAGQTIHKEALKHFEGKRVVIYADNDKVKADGTYPGIDGAKKWRKQLRTVTDNIVILTPDSEGHDLNDEARMKWAAWDEDDPFPDILKIETLHPAKIQRNVKNKTELYNEDSS